MVDFKITSCTTDDGPAIAITFISAFWTDPTWSVIWPGRTREHVISQAARRMPKILARDNLHERHQKVVETSTGAVVGYARWSLPDIVGVDLGTVWYQAQVPGLSPEEQVKLEREYAEADYEWDRSLGELDEIVDSREEELKKGKDYIVLTVVAVHPDHWGRGIATMLVEDGLKEIENTALGLGIFVQAKKAALGVYKRAGFKLVDQVLLDATKFGVEAEYGAYFLTKE